MKKGNLFWIIIIGILIIAAIKWERENMQLNRFLSEKEVSEDIREFGLLTAYYTEGRTLSYLPVEIVDESDTERIKELEEQGIEVDFPNGYFIYERSEVELAYPVSVSVDVKLLNEAFNPEESSIDKVGERLQKHPEFFLCSLHIVNGTITQIEEYFTP